MCMHSLTHSQVALVTSCFVFDLVLQLPLFSSCGSRTGKCGVTVMSPDINLYYIGPVLSKYIVVDSVQSRGQTDRCFAIYGLVPAVCLVVCLVVKLSTTVRKDMCAVYVHVQVTIPAIKTVLHTLGENEQDTRFHCYVMGCPLYVTIPSSNLC